MARELNDPGILDRSSLLADDAPLKKEAQIIIDAFESVTNGMENPEALSSINEIDNNSVLASWKFITLAIKAFYKRDYRKMLHFIHKIEDNTPPKKLGILLLHLSEKERIVAPDNAQKRFIELIQKDRSIFQSTRDLIEDALSNDMEELFIETTILLVREVKRKDAETAKRIALWSIGEAAAKDFSQTLFLRSYKNIFGQAESLRLFALALRTGEPDISILFWLQSLTARIRQGDTSRTVAAAYFQIISDEIDNALGNGIMEIDDHDFREGFSSMILRLHQECSTYFPEIVSDPGGKRSFDLFHKLKHEITGDFSNMNTLEILPGTDTGHNHPGPSLKEPEGRKKQPVQLSLF